MVMSRVQLALNVADLQRSVEFYSTLFGVRPHKRREGYANFEVLDPPLKLVLFQVSAQQRGSGTVGALNHLRVEVATQREVRAAADRLGDAGLGTVEQEATVCCHAEQDKVWVSDPSELAWEVYTITDDAPRAAAAPGADACCGESLGAQQPRTDGCCPVPAVRG